ncbi:MAG: hypothetical protein KTU85_07915, partial [Acidimicrobiia bacterium]|nr:hypothetical protein [Acidimicrobiia bacterium]
MLRAMESNIRLTLTGSLYLAPPNSTWEMSARAISWRYERSRHLGFGNCSREPVAGLGANVGEALRRSEASRRRSEVLERDRPAEQRRFAASLRADRSHAGGCHSRSGAERDDGVGDHLAVGANKGEILGYRLRYEQPIERVAVQGR